MLDLIPDTEIFSVKLNSPKNFPLSFAGLGGSTTAGLLATLASAASEYASKNAALNSGGPQAIDRECDNFMMLDQSYASEGSRVAMSVDEYFDDDDDEDYIFEI